MLSLFNELDTDKNGSIDFREMREALVGSSMTEKEMRNLFNTIDTNNDGEINYDEFLTGLSDKRNINSKALKLLKNRGSLMDNPAIQQLFHKLDTDYSNTINFNEFRQAFLGAKMSEFEMR